MPEFESDPIIRLSANQLEISFLESFLQVIQDADLLDEAIISETAIKSRGLSKIVACKETGASFSLPLSALEKIGAIDTSIDNEFNANHPFVTAFGLEWNNPNRFRGQCRLLGLDNAETLSIPACLRVRAAVQYASNAVINSEKVQWLNAYINSLNVEEPSEFQAWQAANALNAAIMHSEEILKKLALDFDERGLATKRMITSVRNKIDALKESSGSELSTCQINTSTIEPPNEPNFAESLHYRFCFLNRFLLSYAGEISPMTCETNDMKKNRRATLLLELMQQTILVMAQEGKWQTSYQLYSAGIDAETTSFNVPYSIYQQAQLFYQYRAEEIGALEVISEILSISKDYDFSWLRWLRGFVVAQSPVVCCWHDLLKIQNIDELLGDDYNFSAFISDLKTFSDNLCLDAESSWILVSGEMGETPTALMSPSEEEKACDASFEIETSASLKPPHPC